MLRDHSSASDRAVVVALTGGIGSGKSAVTELFRARNLAIFDADVVARELVRPGAEALQEIASVFGKDMLTPSGELDRQCMRERVFADEVERRRLEAILHPRVRAALIAAVEGCTAPYCLLVVPLLVENRADYAFVDRVLVVDVSPRVQIERLMRRDSSSHEAAALMIAAQVTRAERLAIANDVMDNDGGVEALKPVVGRLHGIYLRLAASDSQFAK